MKKLILKALNVSYNIGDVTVEAIFFSSVTLFVLFIAAH